MTVLLTMIKVSKEETNQGLNWQHESVTACFHSMMDIYTVYEPVGAGSDVDMSAAAAAQQNQDAQAQPMNSKQWAQLALSLHPEVVIGEASAEEIQKVLASMSRIVNAYNDRPDVMLTASSEMERKNKRARKSDEEGDDIGLLVGEKKAKTIENFLSLSTPEFWRSIEKHMLEFTFDRSAWSEKLWSTKTLWVGSTVAFEATTVQDIPSPTHESCFEVNWALPLSEMAHNALAKRVSCDFRRATAAIANPDKKKLCERARRIS